MKSEKIATTARPASPTVHRPPATVRAPSRWARRERFGYRRPHVQLKTTSTRSRRGRPIPTVARHPVLGDLLDVRRDGLFEVTAQRFRTLGDIFAIKLGKVQTVVLTHPDHIHHVAATRQEIYPKGASVGDLRYLVGNGLFTADGEEWRQNRSLLQPKFRKHAVSRYAPMMSAACEELGAAWSARLGDTVDMADEMMNLALSIIGRTMFSRTVREQEDAIGEAYREALGEIGQRSQQIVSVPMWVPTESNRRLREAKEFIDAYIASTVLERRRRDERFDDLLDALLDAANDGGMSEAQLRDEVSTVFLAGHETTALALTYAFYLLARNPEVDARLHAELSRILGSERPSPEAVSRLPYTRMVSEEVLRLCPPVWIYPRLAIEDDVIDGYDVPAGTFILICPYFAHRREAAWPDPERFDPERFAGSSRRPAHEFCPFGAGARTCAGLNFAMQEMILALATLIRAFRPEVVKGYAPRLVSKGTLRPDGGMPMILRSR
jgi:cytochrome P450